MKDSREPVSSSWLVCCLVSLRFHFVVFPLSEEKAISLAAYPNDDEHRSRERPDAALGRVQPAGFVRSVAVGRGQGCRTNDDDWQPFVD